MPADKPKNASAGEPGAPFDTIFAFNRNAFQSWAQNMSQLSQEMAQFMQSRLKEEAWVGACEAQAQRSLGDRPEQDD